VVSAPVENTSLESWTLENHHDWSVDDVSSVCSVWPHSVAATSDSETSHAMEESKPSKTFPNQGGVSET